MNIGTQRMAMIDTLKYTRELEKAGLESETAEIFVRGQLQMISENVVTKSDFLLAKSEFSSEIRSVRSEIKTIHHRIDKLDERIMEKLDKQKSDFNSKLKQLEYRMTIKLAGVMAALLTLFSRVESYFG